MSDLHHFDFDLNTGGKGEILERADGVGGGFLDVDEAAVGINFKLLTRVFVDKGGAVDGNFLLVGGKGDGTSNDSAGAGGGVDDLAGGIVYNTVVEGEDFNADTRSGGGFFFLGRGGFGFFGGGRLGGGFLGFGSGRHGKKVND